MEAFRMYQVVENEEISQQIESESIEGYKSVHIPDNERKVQWKSNENKDCFFFQQKTNLQSEIDELWRMMQYSKKRYNKVKKRINCEG